MRSENQSKLGWKEMLEVLVSNPLLKTVPAFMSVQVFHSPVHSNLGDGDPTVPPR